MKKNSIRTLVLCGLFTAFGLLFPPIFHLFGAVSGQTFLPMHIPVLIAGLAVSPVCGAVTGVLSPLLSCLITNMPTMIKMPFMCIELFAYGLFAGLFMKWLQKPVKNNLVRIYVSLILSQIIGRLVNFGCTALAVYVFGINNPAVSVKAALMSVPMGVIGIVIQLLFIPPVVSVLNRYSKAHNI